MSILVNDLFLPRFQVSNRYSATCCIWSGVCAIFRNATQWFGSGLKKWLIFALGADCSGVAVCSGGIEVSGETLTKVVAIVAFDHPGLRSKILRRDTKPFQESSEL